MKVMMDVIALKDIYSACKTFVSKEETILKTIQLSLQGKICTAYALDNYKLIAVSVPYKEGDEGIMHIPIIKLPKSGEVIITDEKNEITFDFHDNKQTVRKYEGKFPEKPETFFPKKEPILKIGFNPKKIRDALDGFLGEERVELNFISPLDGCIIKGTNKKALVLPMKLNQ